MPAAAKDGDLTSSTMKKCDLHRIYIWDFQIPTVINGDILVGIQWVYIYIYVGISTALDFRVPFPAIIG